MKALTKALINVPYLDYVVAILLVATHWALVLTGWVDSLGAVFGANLQVVDLYLGFAGLSGTLAAAAGIIVTFGLTTESPRFERFRVEGGKPLRSTWIHVFAGGFMVGVLGMLAAGIDLVTLRGLAAWVFEYACFVFIALFSRMIWMFAFMISTIAKDDTEKQSDQSKLSGDDLHFT